MTTESTPRCVRRLASATILAQAYSSDVVQLQADSPNLEFVIAESGDDWFIDRQTIPYTTQNQHAAEAWIDYVYDRANYAKLVAFTLSVPVVSDKTDELNKINPKFAANPLIDTPKDYVDRLRLRGADAERDRSAAMGDFINADYLGSTQTTMIGNVIQKQFLVVKDYPGAAALSFLLMAMILAGVLSYTRALGTEDLV